MKKIYLLLSFTIIFSTILFSCASNKAPAATKQEKTVAPHDDGDEVQLVDNNDNNNSSTDEEYLRSINNIETKESVTKAEFEEDKAQILEIIKNLSTIMEDLDVDGWLGYITPESKKYYSDAKHIRAAQKKLPDKTIQLYGIKDYFKYVFVPARKNRRVDEIRYISKTYVKAVQVKPDKSTTVYYYFNKVNGKWLVHIPAL